jgi:hypothetical protein
MQQRHDMTRKVHSVVTIRPSPAPTVVHLMCDITATLTTVDAAGQDSIL